MLKIFTYFILLILLSYISYSQSQSKDTSREKVSIIEDVENSLIEHFKKYPPELLKYNRGLTTYGGEKTKFTSEQIELELNLLDEIKLNKLHLSPSQTMFLLIHNVMIHSPKKGKEIVLDFNLPTKDDALISYLLMAFMIMGEEGEKLVIENILSSDSSWSKTWVNLYHIHFIYESSLKSIESIIRQTNDIETKSKLINSLMYISVPSSRHLIKSILDTTQSDKLMKASIFVYAELVGYKSIEFIKSLKTVGESSEKEKESTLNWLEEYTSPVDLYGTEIDSDPDFVDRFRNLNSPAIAWAKKVGLLNEENISNPVTLPPSKKNILLSKLIASNGFGLAAVKGTLFKSVEKEDIHKLLELRKISFYSPDNFTSGRLNTLNMLIRYLRKQ